jgi:hypothetical protein
MVGLPVGARVVPTAASIAAVEGWLSREIRAARSGIQPAHAAILLLAESPSWDPAGRVLRWGEIVLKAFRQRAPGQERLLAAFHEEGWNHRVDDPLPREHKMTARAAKQRLHDTINNLNRFHRLRLVHFRGDGTGEGIIWELVTAQLR